jgi:hypothetical protein
MDPLPGSKPGLTHHPDVEFHVRVGDRTGQWLSFPQAAGHAVQWALGSPFRASHREAIVDVVVHSREGAFWWGSSEAVAQYERNPDADVLQRIRLHVDSTPKLASLPAPRPKASSSRSASRR